MTAERAPCATTAGLLAEQYRGFVPFGSRPDAVREVGSQAEELP
jgi:hypothetical protein